MRGHAGEESEDITSAPLVMALTLELAHGEKIGNDRFR
jgi:hypothetical protein